MPLQLSLWHLLHNAAFFFVDIYVFMATLLAAAGLWYGHDGIRVAGLWLAFVSAYSALKLWWRRKIVAENTALTAIPSGLAPLFYYLTREVDGGGVQIGHCSGLHRRVVWQDVCPAVPEDVMTVLRRGPVFRNLEEALKLFRPVALTFDQDGAVTSVVSRCVAVRNFRNRYGEITSTLEGGEVINEVAFL